MEEISKERWFSLEDLPNEEWRHVVGWEDLYAISNMGRVKAYSKEIKNAYFTKFYKECIIKPWLSKAGYYMVSLCGKGKPCKKYVHHLVVDAFLPKIDGKNFIDHISTIKTDNRLLNLHRVNAKENGNNPITVEKHKKRARRSWDRGDYKNRNNTHYRRVQQFDKEGNLIATYDSIKEAAEATGTHAVSISKVCLGQKYFKTAGGFVWKHLGGHYVRK